MVDHPFLWGLGLAVIVEVAVKHDHGPTKLATPDLATLRAVRVRSVRVVVTLALRFW
jgi:hypothetical protein